MSHFFSHDFNRKQDQRICLELLSWAAGNPERMEQYHQTLAGKTPCPILTTCEKGKRALAEDKTFLHQLKPEPKQLRLF